MPKQEPSTTLLSRSLSMPCADIMKLLADETRLRIVERLLEGSCNVQSLNATLGVEPTLLSHHLRTLREAALIESERAGRFVYYRLSPLLRNRRRKGVLDFGCCSLSFDRAQSLKPTTVRHED